MKFNNRLSLKEGCTETVKDGRNGTVCACFGIKCNGATQNIGVFSVIAALVVGPIMMIFN